MSHLDFTFVLLDSIVAIAIFYLLLSFTICELALVGFFAGMWLFYWISFSFYYFEMPYLIPFVILSIGAYYSLLFVFLGYLGRFFGSYAPLARALIALYLFDFMTLFGFNWFKLELFLSDSIFGITKIHLAIILVAIAIFLTLKDNKRYLSLIVLLAIDMHSPKNLPNIKIFLATTNVQYESKYSAESVINNLSIIDKAIENGYDMVILPEGAFVNPLNKSPKMTAKLLEKSMNITILCGSIKAEEKCIYNSSYLFKDGKVQIFDKVIGVPFGEVNPMPSFLSDIVNKIFFDGAEDFKTAEKFSDFEIKGVKFRNAICYEATKDEAYSGAPKNMIAISNNTWFLPSLEPEIQKKLITYYSRLNSTVVYHCVNMSQSYVIK